MDQHELLRIIKEAAEDGRTELDLSFNQLTALPDAVAQLQDLTTLDLRLNQLTSVPDAIAQLQNLTGLYLGDNQLTSLPEAIGQLRNLTTLNLYHNQLTSLPDAIAQLQNLTELYLSEDQLTALPDAIAQLKNLTTLDLGHNHLTSLPDAIAQLDKLTTLYLNFNQLTALPHAIAQLQNLTTLDLSGNQLTALPHAIAQLQNLTTLDLRHNQLTGLPDAIPQLQNLTTLDLGRNQLTALPDAIPQLHNLTTLYLGDNELTALPDAIAQLQNLTTLDLRHNQLTALPAEMARLARLWDLRLDGNPLTSPPEAVVHQGTAAVLAYLRERLEAGARQWVSKMLLVGEGGVGKTSLLDALEGKPHDADKETTHGIEIRPLDVAHPKEDGVAMRLNAWDFGGQEIYHATHQFFLTGRSLFLLLWNMRHGWEQGKLRYWLETIHARAPESPVLIVGTHLDQRNTDLPFEQLRDEFPQLAGHYKVSNSDGTGIEAFRAALGEAAAGLPLMGEEWPRDWLKAAEALRDSDEQWVRPKRMAEVMVEHGVKEADTPVLAQYLHDLGDLLDYSGDEDLKDTVILKPQWVSTYISRVLESDGVQDGILRRPHMEELWADLDPGLHDHFLRLMEKFDLSYRTLENREISIVVEKLSQDPPDYRSRWDALEGGNEIAMRFELSTVPAGIPSYFIARSHRFSLHLHWLYGALFSDKKTPEHLGLIRSFPGTETVELRVRGPYPHNFFALLRDGFEVTLDRFPGLKVERFVPCPGHDGQGCAHAFLFEQLCKRLETMPPRPTVECPESLATVDVQKLVFGLARVTQGDVLAFLDAKFREMEMASQERHAELMEQVGDLTALAQREFAGSFRAMQDNVDTHCPNVFALEPPTDGWRAWVGAPVGEKLTLQLYCQAPGEWHPVLEGRYQFDAPPEWLETMAPYVNRMVTVLGKAAPVVNAAVKVKWPDVEAVMGNELKLMTELVKLLPQVERSREAELARRLSPTDAPERAYGEALHTLRRLLDKLEPDRSPDYCGGLKKVLTPEGHYLWLCPHHAEEYRR